MSPVRREVVEAWAPGDTTVRLVPGRREPSVERMVTPMSPVRREVVEALAPGDTTVRLSVELRDAVAGLADLDDRLRRRL